MSSPVTSAPIHYPESDGKPMADNTVQFRWIQVLAGNLAALFRERHDSVFVGGDLFWYPVENFPDIVQAPDVFVVLDRPQRDRGSYKQWEEAGLPMTVVIEVRSPNDADELMRRKLEFYDEYGVEEYYLLDPNPTPNVLQVYVRRGDALAPRRLRAGKFTSPRLGIRFDLNGKTATVFDPERQPFLTFEELKVRSVAAEARSVAAEARSAAAEQRAVRLVELGRKSRRGSLTPEELAELERLEDETMGSDSPR